MIAVYADKDFNDVRAIHPIGMEFAYGEDENDFEVKMAAAAERMDALGYIYVDATECGGIITDIKNDTEDSQLVYSGLTWHGMLATKVIQPDSGEDYYKVSGEVNAVMNAILARIGLDDIMTAGSASTGSVIKSYQFDRYCNAYEGLRKMLASIGKTLMVQSLNGRVYLTAKDTASHTESATTERHAMPINHLVCLGEGELKDREVLHLYADGKGNVGTTQTFTGAHERAEVYDYSSADHDQLLEDGTKKLSEYQVFTSADMTDPTGGGYLIDDGLEVYDPVLDVSLSAQITKKIVTFDKDMSMSTDYECGNGYSSSTNSGASGGSGSGGGKTYVAGHGIKIADLTISAEVGASDLTAGLATKADTSHNHSASDITSGTLAIANGGTGSSTAAAARTALGAAASSHTHAPADLTAAVPVSKGGTGSTTAAAALTALGAAAASHTHSAATNGAAGFMSAADKSKLDGIATGATANTVDSALSSTSTNAVQNKVVNSALADKVPNTSAGVSAAINKLSAGTATPADADYYVCQYADGGTTTTTYHRRPLSSLWNWIKSKADSVYAAVSHTHAASAITSGTLAVANGGTGASTAAAARTNLGAAAASHNHSAADITSGTLPVSKGGTGSTDGTAPYATYIGNGVAKYVTGSSATNRYCRFATIETKSDYVDATMLLAISSGYDGGGFGIVQVSFCSNKISDTGTAYGNVHWLARYGFSTSSLFLKVYSVSNGGGTCYADLYFMAGGTYSGFNARVLVGCNGRGSNGMGWKLKVEDPRAAADMRTYTSTVSASDLGIVNRAETATSATSATKATKLATARTIALTGAVTGSATFDGSANVTITTTGQTAAANFLAAHPVGSTYEETTGTSPASAYGGTWEQLPSMGAFIWKRTA